MKFKAFKINQYSENYKELLSTHENYEIYMTSLSIYDLKDYVYVKTVKDYSDIDNKVFNSIGGMEGFSEYENIISLKDIHNNEDNGESKVNEVQRDKKYEKLQSIGEYIKKEMGIFPTSILLGTNTQLELNIKIENSNLVEISFEDTNFNEGFFIIDGQHRIYGILMYILKKIAFDFKDLIEENDLLNIEKNKNIEVIGYVTKLLNLIGLDKKEEFIKNNSFDLPTVIIHKLQDKKKALLFADINSNATRLDSNLGTWIYGKTDAQKKFIKIFVELGEKLNANQNSALFHRFKIPSDFSESKFSKIGIKPFTDNSLKMLDYKRINKEIDYSKKPFNLLLNELTKYDEEITEDTVKYMSNALSIIYFMVFYNSRNVFGIDKWNNTNYRFINTNNLGLYLYMIKISFLIIYSKHKNDFLGVFLEDSVINELNIIFKERLKNPLEATYKEYQYFEMGKTPGSGASQESKVIKYFKIKLFNLDNITDSRKFNNEVSNREKEFLK